MSSVQLDGSHTPAKRGGSGVSYQGRKKTSTSNTLWLVDASGLSVSFSTPQAGNHNDVYQIQERLRETVEALNRCGVSVDGLFLNANAGFDTKEFKEACDKYGIIVNVPENQRNSQQENSTDYVYFDEELYKCRYTVEQNNAWQDSHRNLLIRHDTCQKSWKAWHYLYAIWQWSKRITLN